MSNLIDKGKRVKVTEYGNFFDQEGIVEKIWWDKRPVEVSVKLDDLERNIIFHRSDVEVVTEKTECPFKVGDRVRYTTATPNSWFHGKEGEVVEILEGEYSKVRVKLSESFITDGTRVVFLENATPKEGEEISLNDIEVGMVVKVTYTSASGDFEQISSKQGTITRLSKSWGDRVTPYVKIGDSETALRFNSEPQAYTLIKHAPKVDEILEAVKDAKPGSVVQIEDGGAAKIIITYIKTDPSTNGAGRWLRTDSRYTTTAIQGDKTVRSNMQTLGQLIIKR